MEDQSHVINSKYKNEGHIMPAKFSYFRFNIMANTRCMQMYKDEDKFWQISWQTCQTKNDHLTVTTNISPLITYLQAYITFKAGAYITPFWRTLQMKHRMIQNHCKMQKIYCHFSNQTKIQKMISARNGLPYVPSSSLLQYRLNRRSLLFIPL